MRDRIVEFPNRYRFDKVDGTDDIYDLIPVLGEVTDEGTPVNKTTMLKDATAALYGFTENQWPDVVLDDVLVSILGLVNKRLRIETGSYVGTGTYGTENPNTLTFSGKPVYVLIAATGSQSFPWLYGMGSGAVTYSPSNDNFCGLSWTETSLSWNHSENARYQLNESGKVYTYLMVYG